MPKPESADVSTERLETMLCLEMPELAVNELVWVQEVVEVWELAQLQANAAQLDPIPKGAYLQVLQVTLCGAALISLVLLQSSQELRFLCII